MTRGRPPARVPQRIEAPIDEALLRQDVAAANELARLDGQAFENTVALAQRLGYDGPLEPALLEQAIGQQMQRSVDVLLDMGRMLLLLKERVPHGDFMACLGRKGIAYRAAAKFMQAALKFSNVPSTAHLKKAIGGAGKLIELLVLDDDEVKALAEDGSVLGITIDAVEAMSLHELRKALREAREQLGGRQRLLDKERAEHQALKDAAELRENPPLPEAEARQLAELRDAAMGAELALQRVLARVDEVMSEPATEAVELAARQTLDYVGQRLLVGAAERGIALCFEGDVDPIYMQQLREQIAAAQAERAAQHKPRRGRQ